MGGIVSKEDLVKPKYPFKVVAAIDFGTTNIGYAFALVNDETTIRTGSFNSILPADRVPTIVLLKKVRENKIVDALGAEARTKFLGLSDTQKKDYLFFRLFKMDLYTNKKLSVHEKVVDHTGQQMDALELFGLVITHLISLAQKVIDEEGGRLDIKRSDVQWMLTVPAIWSDSAREFMVKAASQADIDIHKIRLVLEPEAASLYCRKRLMNITKATSIESLPVGHKYILADLGGGTVDICSHEILAGGKLKELYRAAGGAYGGISVNRDFENLMKKIVSAQGWNEFKEKYSELYFVMMDAFEAEKIKFKVGSNPCSINVEKPLLSLSVQTTHQSFKKCIEGCPSADGVLYSSETNKMTFPEKVMKLLFKYSVNGILGLLEQVEAEATKGSANKNGIQTILLAGGYAESPYLRSEIEARFHSSKILLEQNPGLAVMKGAVMMGFKPKGIIERRTRYSYGFSTSRPFVHGDPEELRVSRDGKPFCDDVFDVMIKAGQIVKYEEEYISDSREYLCTELRGHPLIVGLFRSSEANPKYCTDETCERVGKLQIQAPKEGWPKSVKIRRKILVTDTQLCVEIWDLYSATKTSTEISFLEE